MIDISKLSKQYNTRLLNSSDVETIIALCKGNPLFYEFTEARATKEDILTDMSITPPGKELSDKYYLGYFDNQKLIAVLDLIDGYPNKETIYIGFFMVDITYQGKGIGTSIIGELISDIKGLGYKYVRLGINKGNPQSTHFWNKNGFEIIKEISTDNSAILLAEKTIN